MIYLYSLVLTAFITVNAQTARYDELSGHQLINAEKDLHEFRSKKGQEFFSHEENRLIPEVIRNFIDSADCKFSGNPAEASFPGLDDYRKRDKNVLNPTEVQCHQVGSKQSFKICTSPMVFCSNDLIGGIQKQDFTFVIPAEQDCHTSDPKEALLNSMKNHRYNEINSRISIW